MQTLLTTLIKKFPYLNVEHSTMLLRGTLALLFMAHAVRRFFEPNYFHDFGEFLTGRNVPFGFAVACTATFIEIAGGLLMMFGRYVKWAALGFFSISAGGIIIIHARLGWFVGEWGEGGVEYSIALCAMALLLASIDREKQS